MSREPALYEDEGPARLPAGRQPRYLEDGRRSHDDLDRRSHASSRSHQSRRSHRSRPDGHRPAHRALTESNLRTLSEVSSTAPSAAPPNAYRSPYAETAPRDMALSRPTLHHAASPSYETTPVSSARQSLVVARPRSDPSLRKRKSIDMNLAYGNVPPDLESRVDLDPALKEHPETHARALMGRIEGLLTEAQCLHHTATSIISHLQVNPEAAAAVALTLAELSAVLAKMSPAFLGVVKSGSPAIFALLASPQFLIGTGIAVGVTVVMFGGWKIVQRIREAKAREAEKLAFEMQSPQNPLAGPAGPGFAAGARFAGAADGSFDEAYVLDDELSTIETWRRGIAPFGEDESVDIELISPEAMRSRIGDDRTVRDGDARSVKTHRTAKTQKSHRTHKSGRSRRHDDDDDLDVPERKSSRGATKVKDGGSDAGSHRSHRSSRSKRTERTEIKAIEDGSRQEESALDLAIRPKEKKSMLKQLFKKKKDKEDHERTEVSVMV